MPMIEIHTKTARGITGTRPEPDPKSAIQDTVP